MEIETLKPATPGNSDALLAELQERLTQLEIKASYSDDLLDELNQLVYRQQRHIERLTEALQQLHTRLESGTTPAFRSLRDDIPPHY